MLKDAPTFAEVWPQMEAFLKGQHICWRTTASFDRRVLASQLSGHGRTRAPHAFFVHAQGLAAQFAPCLKKLNGVCNYFGIALNHHHAVSMPRPAPESICSFAGRYDAQMRL